MSKKILFISGTRADFGKLKALIREVSCCEQFEYQIFATGMHMLAKYGSTYAEITKAGFKNVFPYINQDSNVNWQMDIVLASTIQGLSNFVKENRCDLIVVHGDRIEALAGAIVGALNNILVAHIEGGELSGTVDELIRHAVSKLSHLHFVANEDAKRRLVQMGEIAANIFVIGSPDIDIMMSEDLPGIDEVKGKYEISFPRYSIFLYHPVTTEFSEIRRNVETAVGALLESKRNYVVIYPNNDYGTELIFESLQQLKGNPRFRMLPSVRFEYFLSLLKHADFIIGNSSSGIREAPVFGVPTINLGTRQANRFLYQSIVNVPETGADILAAMARLEPRYPPTLHFGRGESAKLFIKELKKAKIWKTSPQKQFNDIPHA